MNTINNTERNYTFMAFGKINESTESSNEIKRYIGLGSSYILGVNPTKAELEKIYERTIEKDPEYYRASCERLEQAQRQQILF